MPSPTRGEGTSAGAVIQSEFKERLKRAGEIHAEKVKESKQ